MFKESFNQAISNLALSLDHNSPEIGFWAGLGLMVGGTSWAIYKSLTRVPEIKDEFRIGEKDVAIRKAIEGLSDEEIEILLKELKKKRNWDYVKAYIGPALMELMGISIEIVAHVEINNRLTTIAGELVATTASYGAYRNRVANLVGEEQEKALYYNKELKTVEVEDKDSEGKVIGTHTEYYLEGEDTVPVDPFTYEYSSETSGAYHGLHEYDSAHLKIMQEDWNRLFEGMPHLYLQDVLRSLQMKMSDETVATHRGGWLNPKYYDNAGDGYIDFRITEVKHTDENGREYWTYMLNFNCDGDIEAKILDQNGLMGTAKRRIDRLAKENW